MLAYLRLLIKNRLSAFSPSNLAYGRGGGSNRNLRGVLYIFLYIFAFGSVLFTITMMESLLFSAFVQMGEPQTMLALLFILCMLVVLVTGFFFVFSSLYFGKDSQIVAALPISDRNVLAARLTMVLISEALIALLFCLPAIIMYGVHIGAGVLYYVKALLFVPLLPMIPVGIIALLSFLLIRVSVLWKRREGVTVLFGFAFLALILYFEMTFTSNIDESELEKFLMQLLLKQRQLIDGICTVFPPIGWLTRSLSGSGLASWGSGLLFAVLSVAVFALVIVATGGKYQQLAIKQTETLARLNNGKKRRRDADVQSSPLMALYKAEMREVVTTPIYAMNGLCGVVLFPLLLAVGLASFIKNPGEMGSELSGLIAQLTPMLYMAAWTAVLGFTCVMNMALFTAVSREGKRNYVSRIIPVAPAEQLQAKLLLGLTINGAIMALMSAVVTVFFPKLWSQTLIALLVGTVFSVLSCAVGLSLDAMRPKYQWKNETEAIKQNVNGLLSMLLTLVMVAVFGVLYYLLVSVSVDPMLCYALIALLIAVSAFAAYRFTMGKAAQRYYLQDFVN